MRSSNWSATKDRLQVQQDARQTRQDILVSQVSWIMPFGKHRGKQICQVPIDYLRYIRSISNNLQTVSRCADEISRRNRLHLS